MPLDTDLVQRFAAHRTVQDEERLLLGAGWQDHDLVFPSERGTPLGARSLARQVDALFRRAEIPHRRLHDLRHTAATLLLAAGVPIVDVSKLLGHSSPEVTARIYAHSFAANRRRAIEAVGRLLEEAG
jgi:integrase